MVESMQTKLNPMVVTLEFPLLENLNAAWTLDERNTAVQNKKSSRKKMADDDNVSVSGITLARI